MVLYFTGTGNSRHIADRIAHALNDTLISLNDRIKSGDTLGAIARKYGTTVTNICRLNGIKSTTTLRIGRSLQVR